MFLLESDNQAANMETNPKPICFSVVDITEFHDSIAN